MTVTLLIIGLNLLVFCDNYSSSKVIKVFFTNTFPRIQKNVSIILKSVTIQL